MNLTQVLTIAAGITGIFGFLAFLGGLWFFVAQKQQTSVIENIAGDYQVASDAIIAILKEFKDDGHRLEALQLLLNVPRERTKDVLDRVKAVRPLANENYKHRARNLFVAGLVLAIIAVAGLLVALRPGASHSNPAPPATKPEPRPPLALEAKIFQRESENSDVQFSDFSVAVDDDMVAVGGGVRGAHPPGRYDGALVTASYPRDKDLKEWVGSSKCSGDPCEHKIVVWAIGIRIKGMSRRELLDNIRVVPNGVRVGASELGSAVATCPEEYELLGGGVRIQYNDVGQCCLASCPTPDGKSWEVRSRENMYAGEANLTSFAVCIRQVLLAEDGGRLARVQVAACHADSDVSDFPQVPVTLQPGFVLTGAGADIHTTKPAAVGINVLWLLQPLFLDPDWQVQVASKAHQYPNCTATVTGWALGLKLVPESH